MARYSNCLANALISAGVKRNDRVGIFMDKQVETPVALYGIMKAGAAYVPLDPSAPLDRLVFVLENCGIRHLVTENSKLRKVTAIASKTSSLQCLFGIHGETDLPLRCVSWDQIKNSAATNLPGVKIIGQDLAYIIYTSGSTGIPKGIMHTHTSGLAFAQWAAREYGLNAKDRLSNHAPLHFDLSIFDYFASAVVGACVVIIPDEYTKLPPSYSKLIAEQKISVLFTVPFALIQLLLHGVIEDRDLSRLRWIIFGGEPLPVKYLRALMAKLPEVKFDNMYGPAEVNGVTHYTVESLIDNVDSIPIGRISSIADALVVDIDDSPVEAGDVGELLIRSPTMMQGYWARPDLNEKSLYRCDVFDGYEAVFYRTGDLVSQKEDGIFIFLGRKDRQIKVRGYRVELDEIEAILVSHDQVEEAAVFAIPAEQGSQQIQATITSKSDETVDPVELQAYLKARLPWYAVPAELDIREQFPRTTTGKIDRRGLRNEALLPDNRV